jgi:SAM-dependent methyltransferase
MPFPAGETIGSRPKNRTTRCKVCGERALVPVIRRDGVPVHQNLLYATPAAARTAARGRLDLHACGQCGFVANVAFEPRQLEYGPAYENSQDHSPAFVAHLDALIDRLTTRHRLDSGRVVEVGCGKGAFLLRLLSRPGNQCRGVGYDPSYTGPPTALDCRVRFESAFFGPGTNEPADAVVCRHVIEHVADPLALLEAIRDGVGMDGVKVFVETPCAAWILRRRVMWDLFYEHCSLFTAHSLGLVLTNSGFRVTTVRQVFGGQYLWAEAVSGKGEWPDAPEPIHLMSSFSREEQARVDRWVWLLDELRLRGPVVVWGAGAKGATFCTLTDPDARRIAAVVDVNPAKQGRFVAGTGHPIISPADAARRGLAGVIVLNPNYHAEVAAELTRLGVSAAVIDLMGREDQYAAHG